MNVMVEYLKLNKKFINKYIKIMLGNKYNAKIAENFYEVYVQNRYLLLDEKMGKNNFKREILNELEKLKIKLIKEDKKIKIIAEQIRIFYDYIMYFDNVIYSKNIEKIVIQAVEKRKKITKRDDEQLKEKIEQVYNEYKNEVQNLINRYKSTEFYLEFTPAKERPKIKKVEIQQNIKFPLLYSEYAISKAIETNPIVEDICFVKYYMLSSKVIEDIITNKQKNEYIVRFPISILNKQQKKKRLMEIINAEFLKYKITLQIDYKDLEKNKTRNI